MANTFNLGNGSWAQKTEKLLAYNAENDNYKPLPFDFDRASTATRVNKQGLIETVGTDEPRIDFLNNTKGHLLLEPQSTNLIPNANQYTGNTVYYTVTPNQSSPDGENNATLFVEKTSTNNYSVNSQNASVVGGQTYSYSFFIKYAGKQNIPVNATDGISGFHANIDILNGTVNSGTAEIKDFGNGWYRVLMTRTVAATANIAAISFGFGTQTGDGTSGFYLFGYQIEQQSFATSYIPTQGSAVTRSAETCNGAGNSTVFNDSEGVLYVEIAALADDATNRRLSLSDGTVTNLMYISYKNYTNQIRAEIIASGSTVFDTTYSATNITTFSKIALKYKQNDFSLYIDGVEIAVDTSGNTPSGLSKLSLDKGDNADFFYGNCKEIKVYNTALTDAELIALTS